MRDHMFSDKVFFHKMTRITLPVALQSLMLAAVAAADAMMLGRVDQNSMAAVAQATQIQFVQNMFLSAVTGAGSILGAQYWGKKDISTLHKLFAMMLRVGGLVSALFCAGCLLIPRQLMSIYAGEELIDIGVRYLRITGWSYLITGVSQCYLTVMKITDHAATSSFISCGAVLLNIILNAVFIFGLLGVPPMGAEGAAVATLISRLVELILSVVFSAGPSYIRPTLSALISRSRVLARDFAKCLFPLLGGTFFWGIGFTLYTAIMGHLGADTAAANSLAAVVRDLTCCLCNGLASAAGIMVGNELGAGDLARGRLYGARMTKLSYLTGFIAMALVLATMPLVLRVAKLTDTAYQYLFGMLLITAFYMIGRSVNTITINGVFAAGGDTLFDVYSVFASMWCVALPLAFFGAFYFHWPVLAVYACTCLDEVGKIPWVMYHYFRYKWVRDLTRDMSSLPTQTP